MRKIILPIIVLMLANIGFAEVNSSSMTNLVASKNGEDAELKKHKEEVKNKINKFVFNSSYQQALTTEVDRANSKKEVDRILEKAQKLNDEIVRIRKKLELTLDYDDATHPEHKEKNATLFSDKIKPLNDAKNAKEAREKEKQIFGDATIRQYEKDLENHIYYYRNNNIFDSYNDDIFFDLKLGGDISNSSFLSSLTLGGTYKLKKPKIKLGGFVQYDYQTSHNISLGTSVVYDNFLGFVRYRLALYNKVVDHNVDLFGKYYYEFKFNKLKVAPTVSLYSTVSSKVKIFTKLPEENGASADMSNSDDIDMGYDAYLLPRIGFDLNLGTKVSYQVLKNLSIFTEPTITVSYNNQRIKGEEVVTPIDRSYFGYDINFGVEYKEKGISVKPILRLTGDMLGNTSISSNIGIGYKF